MKKYGLVGKTLAHSFSKKYFTEKFQSENLQGFQYNNYEIQDLSELKKIIGDDKDLAGLNVTIPYKQEAAFLVDELDEVAKGTGVVNAIRIERKDNGFKLYGYNTDVAGFQSALQPLLRTKHHKALILGTGASSKSVAYALRNIGLDYRFVSRNPSENVCGYDGLDVFIKNDFLVIINTTPLGMFPDVDSCPDIPYQLLTGEHFLFDLVYNPSPSLFLKKGKAHGAMISDGTAMLVAQAEKAWEIWNAE